MHTPEPVDSIPGHMLSESRETGIIGVIALGMAAVSLYLGTIIFLLPDVTYGFGYHIAEWAVVIQSVVIASLFIFFGRVGDQISLPVIFRYGLILLTFGFLCTGLITHPYVYLLSSVLIAIASAMVSAVAGGMIRSTLPLSRLPFGLAVMYLGACFGFIFGPSLVVLVSSLYSWNLFFLIIAPVSCIAAFLTGRVCDCTPSRISLWEMDLPGAGLLIITLFLLMYALVEVFSFTITPVVLLSGCMGIVMALLLWYHQKRTENPFLSSGWMKTPGIMYLVVLIVILVLVYRGAVFLSRIFLQEMVWADPVITGLILIIPGITFIPLVFMIGTMAGSWNLKRYIRISIWGVFLGSLGAVAFGFFTQWSSILALLCFGAYNACIRIPVCTLFFARVSQHESGIAGGMLETCAALVIPLIVPITGASFHAGYTRLSHPPAGSCGMDEIIAHLFWGNLGDALFFFGCCLVQMILIIWLSRIIREEERQVTIPSS